MRGIIIRLQSNQHLTEGGAQMTRIQSNLSIYEITKNHPEIIDIMVSIGFQDILKPGLLQTTGRNISLEKGAKLRNIDFEVVRKAFEEKGFSLGE